MTYPVDEMTSLAKANGQLFTALTDIGRSGAQDYFELNRKLVDAYAERLKGAKPGAVAAFDPAIFTDFLGQVEKQRAEALAKTKAALEEWQSAARALVPDDAQRQKLTDTVQSWIQPVLNPLAEAAQAATASVKAATAPVSPAAPEPAKAEAAEPAKAEKPPLKPVPSAV